MSPVRGSGRQSQEWAVEGRGADRVPRESGRLTGVGGSPLGGDNIDSGNKYGVGVVTRKWLGLPRLPDCRSRLGGVTLVVVAVTTGSVVMAVVGGSRVSMEVRAKVVSGESKFRVRVSEHRGRLGQQQTRQQK